MQTQGELVSKSFTAALVLETFRSDTHFVG